LASHFTVIAKTTAELPIEGVFAYFTPIKCQIRIKEGVWDVRYVFTPNLKKIFFAGFIAVLENLLGHLEKLWKSP
jgi:hypothetical protein